MISRKKNTLDLIFSEWGTVDGDQWMGISGWGTVIK
jgi:hypothetical protein